VGYSVEVLLQICFSICVPKIIKIQSGLTKLLQNIEGCNFFATRCSFFIPNNYGNNPTGTPNGGKTNAGRYETITSQTYRSSATHTIGYVEGTNREIKSRFMTSLNGAEMSDNCGFWAPRLMSDII